MFKTKNNTIELSMKWGRFRDCLILRQTQVGVNVVGTEVLQSFTCFTDENIWPWSVFAHGHVAPSLSKDSGSASSQYLTNNTI